MYYLDESYDGPPGNYGLDAGSNDAAGGRGQTAPHNASHHHAPMYIPPHMMTMPNHAYMPSVPNTHQLHMNPLNVHSHLTAPSGPSLRTSAEIPPMQYSTNQASSMQHRPNPTYHPTQSQSSQVSMASSSGVSGGSFSPLTHRFSTFQYKSMFCAIFKHF